MSNKKRRNNKAVFRKFASTAALGTMLISPMAPAMNVVAEGLEGEPKHSLVQPRDVSPTAERYFGDESNLVISDIEGLTDFVVESIISVVKDEETLDNHGLVVGDGGTELEFTDNLDVGVYIITLEDDEGFTKVIELTITPFVLSAGDIDVISQPAEISREFNDDITITAADINSPKATINLKSDAPLDEVELDLTPLVEAELVSFADKAIGVGKVVQVDFGAITEDAEIEDLVNKMFDGTNFTLNKAELGADGTGNPKALASWLNTNSGNFFTGEILPATLSEETLNRAFNAGEITRTIVNDAESGFTIDTKPMLDFTKTAFASLGEVELNFEVLNDYKDAFTFEHNNPGDVGVAFDVTGFMNTASLEALLGEKANDVIDMFNAEGSVNTLQNWIEKMAGNVEDGVVTPGQFFTATNQVDVEFNDQMRIRAHATGEFGSQNNVTTDENGVLQVGTVGQAQALHTFQLELKDENGNLIPGIKIGGHVQTTGDVDVANGQRLGTAGQRLEGINIHVDGDYQLTGKYTIEYRMHVQGQGWLDWADIENHEFAGTEGYSIRGEAIQVRVVDKNAQAEAESDGGQIDAAGIVSLDAAEGAVGPETNNDYKTVNVEGIHHIHPTVQMGTGHVQGLGNLHGDGGSASTTGAGIKTIGTTGQGRRLEELTLGIENAGLHGTDGLVKAEELQIAAHLQGIGWTKGEVDEDGTVTVGTRGQSRRLEALAIELPKAMQQVFSIQYRVHVQGQGWLAWTADGGLAGTTGQSRRIEAVQVRIVPRGAGLGLPTGGSANAGVLFTGDFADLNTVQEIQNPPATEPETEPEE
ncbi:hypothetical protein [Lactococcus allomyrinae]|uniref:Uncharacterized protein n=1 Tax=Lactococcus allomyrinae TaxID=2419773 RepID=A0A387BFA5_9LACT|nr:hypothetical protein [Lactococcus allomyrinae]AYG00954.1 hypothetical protein D7I46_07520 [Lactococcus allomyrinae]